MIAHHGHRLSTLPHARLTKQQLGKARGELGRLEKALPAPTRH